MIEFDTAAAFNANLHAASTVRTVDTHTAGEPLRIILDGVPLPGGSDILSRRRAARQEWDRYRRLLMYEPRGHADMYGALIVPPISPEALFGVLFMHNEGYSTGCGHATIALAKVAVEFGWVQAKEPLTTLGIDSPAGLLKAFARVEQGRVTSSGFENVPSFTQLLDRRISVPEYGEVTFDLAFGGAFYAYVDADEIGLVLEPHNSRAIIQAGMAIKRSVAAKFLPLHPVSSDLSFLYGVMFIARPRKEAHSRHVCVFADGALDRSPTGTGVAGRLAILRAKGEVRPGESLVFEGITGECFVGKVLHDLEYHSVAAVVPEIEGNAFVTGRHEFIIQENDPLKEGFFIR